MQLRLDFSEPFEELPCAFGNLEDAACRHHCHACDAEVARLCGGVA